MQAIDPKTIKDGYEVIVFVGSGQKSVKTETAILIDSLDDRGSFFPVVGNGKNAVDLHIAFRAGQLSIQHPKAQFHILSGDGDFIPLVTYLNTQKIPASNGKTVAPPAKEAAVKKEAAPAKKTVEQIAATFKARIMKPKATKPATVKTLRNAINNPKVLTKKEIDAVVALLEKGKVLKVDGLTVKYP